MTYTAADLDSISLLDRVDLATKGDIPWDEVNRPEADAARERAEQASLPLHRRLADVPFARDSRERRRRRYVRQTAGRRERAAFSEMMYAAGISMSQVQLPPLPSSALCI